MKEWFEKMQSAWVLFSQTVAWITAAFGGFLLAPPLDAIGADAQVYYEFIHLLLILFIGFLYFPLQSRSRKDHFRGWLLIAILGTIISSVLFITFQTFKSTHTVPYPQGSSTYIIAGDQLTAGASRKLKQTESGNMSDLVMDAAGDARQLWPEEQIVRNTYVLLALFFFSSMFFTVSIITLLQSIRCYQA